MKKSLLFAIAVIFCIGTAIPTLEAEGISREQGDAILEELKAIRTLLQNSQRPPTPEPAQPERVKISTRDGVALGSKKAPLVLIEFTDYQCPYCKRFNDTTFAQLKKRYIDTGKLRFISRNLPLPFHNRAESAALATACAGDQGKYWQMRRSIFANPQQLEADHLSAYAKDNGINVKRFDRCMVKQTHQDKIRKDVSDAQAIGIGGTPSFVLARNSGEIVEGEKVVGALPFAAFQNRIESMLKEK